MTSPACSAKRRFTAQIRKGYDHVQRGRRLPDHRRISPPPRGRSPLWLPYCCVISSVVEEVKLLVAVRVPESSDRSWHCDLLKRINAVPMVTAQVIWGARQKPLPFALRCVFDPSRERSTYEAAASERSSMVEQASSSEADSPKPDILLDLCGGVAEGYCPTWSLMADGEDVESGVLSSIVRGRAPVIYIFDRSAGDVIASARPHTEANGKIYQVFEEYMQVAQRLVCGAVAGCRTSVGDRPPRVADELGLGDLARYARSRLTHDVVKGAYRTLCYAPHWRVGWRIVDGADIVDLKEMPCTAWNELPDDGFHFYADPFPIEVNGRIVLFVEDFDHRVGRGVISAVEFNSSGPVSRPVPVLSSSAHFSYPFVFQHDGEIWMVPESASARRVELYRAKRFPDVWEHEAVLLNDVEASDATLIRVDGRWWMMATVRFEGGSYSDALCLWSAEKITGPWIAHRKNPVLVDAAAARPAGRVVSRGGSLIRPVQDCRLGYGAALALAKITRLDEAAFEQSVVASIKPGPSWRGTRLHTLNRAGKLEFIDGSSRSYKAGAYLRRWTGRRLREGSSGEAECQSVLAGSRCGWPMRSSAAEAPAGWCSR
ncbi:conserved hypothetical protein [Methylobacterium sp. 4-46]|nr:conserved hypothetical protein [Methylobacterium sp. 4-46]